MSESEHPVAPEQKSNEQEIKRWAHVFEHAGWGIVISAKDGQTMASMNPAFARMHGWTVEELTGQPIAMVFSPRARAGLAGQIEKANARTQSSFESEHVRKDGTTFPVAISVTTVRDEAGELQYRAVHLQDISERRAQEEALRVASLSRDVLDRLLEGCQVISFDWRYLYINDLVALHAHLPKELLVGRTMMECYPGIETTPMFAVLRRSMTQRTHERMENDFTYPNGTRICFELKFLPVPQGVCILSLDITEKRHRLSAIVNDSDDAIIGRTLDGVVTSWNRSAERIFGYSAEEIIGKPIGVLFPARTSDEEALLSARLVRGERIAHFATVCWHKDGSEIDVSITLSPIRDAVGRIIGVSMSARDITELKAVQEQLIRAKESAEAANRELEAFSYSVAHDLRAPLRSIDGFSQALLEDCADKLDDEGRKYLRYVCESAQLMAQLIDNLLALSRVNRSELAREWVDLSALAAAALGRIERGDPNRLVQVRIQPELRVIGDPRLLGIMLDNLLGNAWKFSAKREGACIEFGAAGHGETTEYFVRDNGAGFDMAYAHNLFGAFQRLHSAHEFEGTGIGLATVQRIVHRHGGRVWAEGKVDGGATFHFTLGNKERIG